ncbi:hypothetical protein [Streptococcus pyogenes]|nr:hypothetical protein [Streptococcus pyogenes]
MPFGHGHDDSPKSDDGKELEPGAVFPSLDGKKDCHSSDNSSAISLEELL